MSSEEKKTEFEPKIVAFLCNWCAYRSADLAALDWRQRGSALQEYNKPDGGRDPSQRS